jgi:hypothetical protein
MNERMYSYATVDIAHAELLLVACLEKKNPQGKKNLLPLMYPL